MDACAVARPGDQPYPVAFDFHPECDTLGLHVAITVLSDQVPGIDVWDTALWDDPASTWTDSLVWVDIAGDVQGLVVENNGNELNGQPEATHLTMQLKNSTGRYNQFDNAGNLSDFVLGSFIAVWLDDGIENSWKFFGRITRWEEDHGQGPDAHLRAAVASVEVEAYTAEFLLSQSIDGLTYHLGPILYDTPGRIAYLALLAGFNRGFKLEPAGLLHDTAFSTNPVYESIQVTAESAGGIVFIDNDGSLTYLGPNQILVGRTDQPKPIPVYSDGCQPDTRTFSDGDPITDDTDIRNVIRLTNLQDQVVSARNQQSVDLFGQRILALDQQTWYYDFQAQPIADGLLARFANIYFRVDEMTLYGESPDLRIGDVVRYIRTLTNGTRVDVNLRITGTSWSYSPLEHITVLATTPVTAINAFSRWDESTWDDDNWTF
jgi:hypothetical protein